MKDKSLIVWAKTIYCLSDLITFDSFMLLTDVHKIIFKIKNPIHFKYLIYLTFNNSSSNFMLRNSKYGSDRTDIAICSIKHFLEKVYAV